MRGVAHAGPYFGWHGSRHWVFEHRNHCHPVIHLGQRPDNCRARGSRLVHRGQRRHVLVYAPLGTRAEFERLYGRRVAPPLRRHFVDRRAFGHWREHAGLCRGRRHCQLGNLRHHFEGRLRRDERCPEQYD